MRKKYVPILLATIAILALPAALHAQGTDPESTLRALGDALVAKDIDGALALLADDAVVTVIPPPEGTNGVFTGKEEIRVWYEQLVAWNFEAEFSNFEVEGDKATWSTKAWADPFRALGIAPLEYAAEGVVQDGKVKSYTDTMTADSVAKLQAAMAQSLPDTGIPPATQTLPLGFTVAALLLIGMGLVVRRAAGPVR